jgi:hypothetical protein
MELFACEMGEVQSRRCFAQHMSYIQMDGDGNVWDNMLVYLREFVAFPAFIPLNEMLRFLCFVFPLAHAESLLLAS